MIVNTYEIVKVEVSASYKYYGNYYELNIWFKDDDINTRGRVYNVSMCDLKEKSSVNRGDGFKKIQTFLNTEEGKFWLSKYLKKQDIKKETDKIKDSLRLSIYKMDLETLKRFDEMGKEILNNATK